MDGPPSTYDPWYGEKARAEAQGIRWLGPPTQDWNTVSAEDKDACLKGNHKYPLWPHPSGATDKDENTKRMEGTGEDMIESAVCISTLIPPCWPCCRPVARCERCGASMYICGGPLQCYSSCGGKSGFKLGLWCNYGCCKGCEYGPTWQMCGGANPPTETATQV